MAEPFLKWPGGKRSMLPDLLKRMPERIENYWEPFVGGGAVFFAVTDRVDGISRLSDLNEDLITTYMAVQNFPDQLIARLSEHAANHPDPDYFYRVRESTPTALIEVAARFIYLNRTCFNGLYRVNRKGKFNVSRGAYKNPTICDEGALHSASWAFEDARIDWSHFTGINELFDAQAIPGDVVFCDPPYDGVFTSYTPFKFSRDEHRQLRDCAFKWRDDGARVIITNADNEFTRDLYRDFDVERVEVLGRIACKTSGRTPAGTLIAELRP